MKKLSTCLWFDTQAEEAANFYVDVFSKAGREAHLGTTARYGPAAENASGKPAGSVMTVSFVVDGHEFLALNGGPQFKFGLAISFIISCDTQKDIDYFWERLSEGGEAGQCGWINRDKFGLAWQIVPSSIATLMAHPDKVKSERAMKAMLAMTKLDIAKLQAAFDGE